MCSRCLLYKGKGLIPLNSTLEKIYGRFEVKIREKILDFSQIISCYFFWGLNLWKSTPFPYKTNIWEHFKSIEWVLGFIPWKEIRKPSAPFFIHKPQMVIFLYHIISKSNIISYQIKYYIISNITSYHIKYYIISYPNYSDIENKLFWITLAMIFDRSLSRSVHF